MNQAVEIVLPTDSGLIFTGSGPADVMMLATFKLCVCANDHAR
jgi:hypothetical protein